MCTDTSLVALGVVLMLIFFHHWDWKMIGVGTLVSMLYVGFMVRQYSPHLSWLDKIFIPADERKTSTDERQKATAEEAAVPFIITIAREYGSGGAALSELVSKKLGVDFYDQNIMDAAAARLGYTTDFVKSKEQNISNAKLLKLIFTDKSIPESWNPSQDDAIFNCESQIIHTFAMKKPCVIIGRCANWVLRDDDKAFSVFVTSKKEDAVKRIMDKDGVDSETAEKRIEQVNTDRNNHYYQYTGCHWADARNYDLVVNTSVLGLEKCADIRHNSRVHKKQKQEMSLPFEQQQPDYLRHRFRHGLFSSQPPHTLLQESAGVTPSEYRNNKK